MRRLALIACLAGLSAASVAFAATGGTAVRPASLGDAVKRTTLVSAQRFAVDVHIAKKRQALTLRVRGATTASSLSVKMKMDDLRLADGTLVEGMDGAVLIDGPFLYERAPRGIAVGQLRWLRQRLADLSPASAELRNIRGLTSRTLLQVLSEARVHRAAPRVFRGTVAYHDPVVRRGLGSLTGNIEFRGLHVTAWVGKDRLVHRLRITGRTADRSAALRLEARLFGFGMPVRVRPPAPGVFLDPKREQLTN